MADLRYLTPVTVAHRLGPVSHCHPWVPLYSTESVLILGAALCQRLSCLPQISGNPVTQTNNISAKDINVMIQKNVLKWIPLLLACLDSGTANGVKVKGESNLLVGPHRPVERLHPPRGPPQ